MKFFKPAVHVLFLLLFPLANALGDTGRYAEFHAQSAPLDSLTIQPLDGGFSVRFPSPPHPITLNSEPIGYECSLPEGLYTVLQSIDQGVKNECAASPRILEQQLDSLSKRALQGYADRLVAQMRNAIVVEKKEWKRDLLHALFIAYLPKTDVEQGEQIAYALWIITLPSARVYQFSFYPKDASSSKAKELASAFFNSIQLGNRSPIIFIL